MTLHSEAVKEIDLDALRGHTPGPWTWWTSCSFRRLSARGDGDVLCAVTQSDGHPDVFLKNGGWEGPDGLLIAAAPDLFSECERLRAELTARRARDAEVAELVAALRHARDELASFPRSLGYAITALPKIDAALRPFQRSDDKGVAT
jgi:hypothetical protein